ncbi:MAG: Ig-like domain-containing protein, partial [bacterium]|nr:Ig-like domain-containing protein [bacterium]
MADNTDGEKGNKAQEGAAFGTGTGQHIEPAIISPDGTITVPGSGANLESVDVADVDLVLGFSGGIFVVIPNGALDAISDSVHPVVFAGDKGAENKSTLGELFKNVGVTDIAESGSLRLKTDKVETKKTGVDEPEVIVEIVEAAEVVKKEGKGGGKGPGKGPGMGLTDPAELIDPEVEEIQPPITPRPPDYQAGKPPPPTGPTIELDPNITADDIIDAAEAGGPVTIEGNVGRDAKAGDTVELTLSDGNSVVTNTGLVFDDGVNGLRFSIVVDGSNLVGDDDWTIEARVTTYDGAGNSYEATDTETYTVTGPWIRLDTNITADDIISIAEEAGNVTITGGVGGDAQVGDTVTLMVNGVDSTGLVFDDGANGLRFSIDVAGGDLVADSDTTIDASITTASGTATDTEGYSIATSGVALTNDSFGVGTIGTDSDLITNDGSLTLTGISAGATVEYRVDKDGGGFSAWSTTYTPPATDGTEDGDYTVEVQQTLAGNTSSVGSLTFTHDSSAPTAPGVALANDSFGVGTTGTNSDLLTNDDTLTLTGIEADAIVEYSIDGGATWASSFTSVEGPNTVEVRQTDIAGNTSNVASLTFDLDTTAPVPTINLDGNITANSDNIINIVEAGGDITITGTVGGDAKAGDIVSLSFNNANFTGTYTGLVEVDNVSFSIDVPGSALVNDGDLTIDASVTTYDAAGNTGTGTSTEGYSVDIVAPTATIVVDDTALKIGDTANVTITFNEAVSGLTNGDLSIANGTLSAVSSADGGITWTATLTPDAPVEDATNIITLADASIADLAGNTNTGTTDSNNYAIDTLRPTATIVVADNALAAGETSLVTITFSEAVTSFDNTDLSVANGTLSAVSSADGGITWTATLTPTADLEDTTNIITLADASITDLAGNTNTGTTDSNNYAIDTLRPTATISVADTALAAGETSLVTITFSEAVTSFDNTDLSVANGTLSAVSSADGGITWTATLTPTA